MAVAAPATPVHAKNTAFYRPELDALRFFAFLCVFINHTVSSDPHYYAGHGLLTMLAPFILAVAKAGAYGVDLFFVLSAYLITELLTREKDSRGTLDVRAFWVRRILRIWPLYFLFLGFSYLWQFFDPLGNFPLKYLLAFVMLGGNWMSMRPEPLGSPAAPLWSVSIEEQFYLLWPLVVRRASATAIRWIAFSLIAVANIVRLISLLAGVRYEQFYWKNTFTRLDPIAIGILLAVILGTRLPRFSVITRLGWFMTGLVAWLVVSYFCDTGRSFVGTLTGYPLMAVGSLCLLLATLGSTSISQNNFLTYLGKISYGLYVFHLLGIRLAVMIFGRIPHTYFLFIVYWVLALGLTTVLAAVSYRWVEMPFLELKKRFTYVASRPTQPAAEK